MDEEEVSLLIPLGLLLHDSLKIVQHCFADPVGALGLNFERSAFGVRCVLASLFQRVLDNAHYLCQQLDLFVLFLFR